MTNYSRAERAKLSCIQRKYWPDRREATLRKEEAKLRKGREARFARMRAIARAANRIDRLLAFPPFSHPAELLRTIARNYDAGRETTEAQAREACASHDIEVPWSLFEVEQVRWWRSRPGAHYAIGIHYASRADKNRFQAVMLPLRLKDEFYQVIPTKIA